MERWFDMAFSGDSEGLKGMLGKLMNSLGKSDQYQYSYNPENQSYTQLSGPGSSEDSPGNRIMARVLQFADKGDPRYSYNPKDQTYTELKKGGKVKMSSASKRADGCATKGKTRGRMV